MRVDDEVDFVALLEECLRLLLLLRLTPLDSIIVMIDGRTDLSSTSSTNSH